MPPFIYKRNYGNVIGEIDVHKERGFLICEVAFKTKKTAVKRPVACAADSGDQIGPVVWSESTDFDRASIAQRLYRGILFDVQHEPELPIAIDRGGTGESLEAGWALSCLRTRRCRAR
jgi:hypothetical protein